MDAIWTDMLQLRRYIAFFQKTPTEGKSKVYFGFNNDD